MIVHPNIRSAAQQSVETLFSAVAGTMSVVASTADGFAIASRTTDPAQTNRIAAMSSSIAAIGAVAGAETLLGQLKCVTVEFDTGILVVMEVPDIRNPLVLTLVLDQRGLLGNALFHCKQTVKQLADSLAALPRFGA